MHAVILAGGRGTRLRPYTTAIPKPLVPIGDQYSILEIILLQLARQGFTRVTLAIGHFGYLIRSYVGDGSRWGLTVDYVEEDVPLGTIGSLLPALDGLPDDFLVMNGDVLTDLALSDVLVGHVESGLPLTVATFDRRVHVDFGVLTTDGERITGFREKPTLPCEVSMGVYAISRSLLRRFPPGAPLGFDELVLDLLGRGERVRAHHFDGYWLDIGRPEDYDQANADFDVLRPVLLPTLPVEHPVAPKRPVGTNGHRRSTPADDAPARTGQHVVVVGAGGYLGRHVLQDLAGRPDVEVTVLGRGSSRPSGHRTVELDLVEAGDVGLQEVLRGLAPTAVVNCAGAVSGDAETLARANVWLVGILARAIAEAAPEARLVHLGSAAEYGAGTPGVPAVETDCARAVGPYALSKLAGTEIVLEAAASGWLRAVVLRVFNPIGPGAGPTSLTARVLAEVDRVSLVDDAIRLGPLDSARDFVDVRDVASAAVQAALLTGEPRRLYNVGSGRAVPVRHFVDALCRVAGYTGEVHEELAGSERSGHVPWQCADIQRARADLSWSPSFGLEEAVCSIVDARVTV